MQIFWDVDTQADFIHPDGKHYVPGVETIVPNLARLVDAAIVADHLILAAANLGLGTCWIAAFNVEAARSALQLPDEVEPVIFTPLGYPEGDPFTEPEGRKPLEEIVMRERWEEK